MRLELDGTDVSAYADGLDQFDPSDSDLGQQIATASFTLLDRDTSDITKVPREGHEVALYDDADDLIFGGYVAHLEHRAATVIREWRVTAQDWNARLFETATGSLNKAGLVDSDRNYVIAILRDALQAQTFGVGTGLDDPIVTANEPDWMGVQGTAVVVGSDFSYMSPKAALDLLLGSVPSVHLRIRADKVVEYGLMRGLAPFAVHTSPAVSGLVAPQGYSETVRTDGHLNKMRRGGAGAAEETAFDEVSYGRYGRILDSPYTNDENVPSGSLRQRTYAELRTHRVRRTVTFGVNEPGLKAGQLIDVVNERLGSGSIPAPFLGSFASGFSGRSATGRIAGERGRFLIQKVRTQVIRPGALYAYQVEAGDNVRDFATGIAVLRAEV